MKFFLLILKNLLRNPLRSTLTPLSVVFLVAILSAIGSVLLFLHRAMAERAADVPVVLTERYRIPSRFDRVFMERIVTPGTDLNTRLKYDVPGFNNENYTLWHFIVFTTDTNEDVKQQNPDLQFFLIATLPDKIRSMTDDMENLDPQLVEKMKNPPVSGLPNSGILMGEDRLSKLGKKVGDCFKARSISHREGTGARRPIELDFEIVGALPGNGRWAEGAFMDYDYLDRVLKAKQSDLDGKVNLGWLKFEDSGSAGKGSGIIEENVTEVKSEIASTAVSRFLEPYKSLLDGVTYILVPAIVFVMVLIVANAISITVRERTREMAVLKVLGFRPGQILFLVLGEGLLLGTLAGLAGAGITYWLVNNSLGGIKFPIAFFPVFFISGNAWWWGPALGAGAALLGGFIPAWNARGVRVAEVFAKVA
jgi:putative ABC transport system permease protein